MAAGKRSAGKQSSSGGKKVTASGAGSGGVTVKFTAEDSATALALAATVAEKAAARVDTERLRALTSSNQQIDSLDTADFRATVIAQCRPGAGPVGFNLPSVEQAIAAMQLVGTLQTEGAGTFTVAIKGSRVEVTRTR